MHIVEVGPRDGLQNEKTVLGTDTKVAYITRIIAAGVTRIEAVSFARPDRVPQMADAEAVMAAVPRDSKVSYIGLVMNERGAHRAIRAGVDEANIVVVATDTFAARNQGMTSADSLRAAGGIADILKSAGIKVSVTIGAAFGCPFEGEVSADRIAEMVSDLAQFDIDELALADTIGVAVPAQVRRAVSRVTDLTDLPLRMHFHNTRNTGYANAQAAMDLGVAAFDASSAGIGGCPFAPAATGNISTEDLLYLASRSGYDLGLDFNRLLEASDFVTRSLGIDPPALLGRAGWFPPRQ
ncbi:MAG: hydroxymethylglutaryl-CoA lyase [Salinibacterium sp.]|nr:hydroxymethylglutaryl-CoA lyase [Salinibacterium sp.]